MSESIEPSTEAATTVTTDGGPGASDSPELSLGALVLGLVVGFVVALIRPRSWK